MSAPDGVRGTLNYITKNGVRVDLIFGPLRLFLGSSKRLFVKTAIPMYSLMERRMHALGPQALGFVILQAI